MFDEPSYVIAGVDELVHSQTSASPRLRRERRPRETADEIVHGHIDPFWRLNGCD